MPANRHTLEISVHGKGQWAPFTDTEPTQPNRTYVYNAFNLKLKTQYSLRMRLAYADSGAAFIWPTERTMETAGDVPDKPLPPTITKEYSFADIRWIAPNDNGYPIEYYVVQMASDDVQFNTSDEQPADSTTELSSWASVCNSTGKQPTFCWTFCFAIIKSNKALLI